MNSQWEPKASLETLKIRAQLMSEIREFFNYRGYLEVETPIMGSFGVTDLYLENIEAVFRGKTYYLQTSPEYFMKRLLAAGSGPIFQIGKVFRDDEWGRWHNPEFTMLEWYRPGIDHHELMNEMGIFLQYILGEDAKLEKITYQEAFFQACQIDPFDVSISMLKKKLADLKLDYVLPEEERDPDQYLFLLMTHVVEPNLSQYPYPIAIYDYPASQAALAKKSDNNRAERFEIYYKGIELANGFHELTDYESQKSRFEQEVRMRSEKGLIHREPDVLLLQALKHGLPESSGVALGVDRLLALKMQFSGIDSVLAF